jgi:hypothetical protein
MVTDRGANQDCEVACYGAWLNRLAEGSTSLAPEWRVTA